MKTYWKIILFFLVTYIFTWFGILGNYLLPSDAWPVPMNPLGPLIAAFLLIPMLEGRKGFKIWWKRITKFKAPGKIYIISFVIPSLIIITSVLLAIAFGAKTLPISQSAIFTSGWIILLSILLEPIFGPVPEELSFRGYAQHELQTKISPFITSLWIGVGVIIWHIPLIVTGNIPWPIVFALPAVSVVYAWLYNTGGSVWPLILLHSVQNIIGGMLFGSIFSQSGNLLWIGFLAGFYILWAIIIVWLVGASLKSKSLL